VAVIVASGGTAPSLAAKAATTTIPIIFTAVADPVKAGLVASLNRPGGNVTGIDAITAQLDSKRLQLLGSLLPTGSLVGVLINADRPDADIQVRDFQAAGQTVGQQVAVQKVRTEPDIDTAITILVQQRIGALVVAADPFLNSRREQLVALAARHAVPAIYQWREFVTGGGLMSYGPSLADAYRQAGNYAGRILRGEKPADLPVMRPTKFSLVINLKTATALGLTIPQSILLLADEVIE
jgi:putative ABC transport system substrate-binding protein